MRKRKNSLETIVSGTEQTLDTECLCSALALVPPFPHICGKANYLGINKNGAVTRNSSTNISGTNRSVVRRLMNRNIKGMPYSSDELVYKLRCAFLHNGTSKELENVPRIVYAIR